LPIILGFQTRKLLVCQRKFLDSSNRLTTHRVEATAWCAFAWVITMDLALGYKLWI
jgi:hypothetical protein